MVALADPTGSPAFVAVVDKAEMKGKGLQNPDHFIGARAHKLHALVPSY